MSNLKLFHVNVSQQWTTEAEAFVWADSRDEAERVAELNIDLNSHDADYCGKDVRGSEASFEFLDKLGNKEYFYFFAPHSNVGYIDVNYETFKSYITPEDLERMRIEKIEANNGQLPLPLEQ